MLLQELGERRIWRTSGGIVVATEGGRVTATAGLRQMLAATRFEGPDPLARPAALLDHPAEARRLVDLMDADREPDGMRFGISLDCRLRAEPTEDAEVLLVRERCRSRGSSGFTNRFWVEAAGGAVIRAEQWVGPRVPMLVMEFLGPAG
ncbi:YjbF family lipoprotein [Paeniroseomonas aquatica]|uniref:YjbF family lipoprotein n=1 Tax=Paeniroseomonas aquatica TaxID=373043 RepID=UPI003608DC1F